MRTLAEINHELQNGSPRTRFVIEGLLPAGLCVVYGPTGSGKTGVAVRMAAAVAGGLNDFGDLRKGAVLFVAAEDAFGAQERLIGAAVHCGIELHTVPIGIADPMPVDLAKSEKFILAEAQKLTTATGFPVQVVVIDTYGTALGNFSQDDAQPATQATGALEEVSMKLGCAVLVVHHSGKSGTDMRGSQVLADRADAVIRVSQSRSGTGEMRVEKMRNARANARFSFEIGSQEITTSSGPIDVQVVGSVKRLDEPSRITKTEAFNDVASTAVRDADIVFDAFVCLTSE